MTESFLEATQRQCELMLMQARRAEQRGYIVLVHRLNTDARHNTFLHSFLSGGFNRFAQDFHIAKGRLLVVDVWPDPAPDRGPENYDAARIAPFDNPFVFTCRVPNLVKFKPIIAALELLSARRRGKRGVTKGSGILTCVDMTACCEYRGQGKETLTTFLRILEMPMHQTILLGKRQCPTLSLVAA